MRTIYFIEKDKSVSLSRRRKALLLTRAEWQKFKNHISKRDEKLEEIERKKEEEKKKNEEREEILRSWKNTFMDARRVNLERRKTELERYEKEKEAKYQKIREEEEELRNIALEKAKALAKLERDEMKTLISALRFSEVLRERAAQIEFDKWLREKEKEKEKELAQKRIADVEAYRQELEKEQQELKEKVEKENELRTIQFERAKKMKEEADKKRLNEELEEILLIQTEMVRLQDEEKSKEMKRRQMLVESIEVNKRLRDEHLQLIETEKRAEDNAVHIHAVTKQRLARKIQVQQMKIAEQKREKTQKLYEAAVAALANQKETFDEETEKVMAEKLTAELKKDEARKIHRMKLAAEKKQAFEDFLKTQEMEREKERDVLREEMMQRAVKVIANERMENDLRKTLFEKAQLCRENWDEQCLENGRMRKMEKQLDKNAVERSTQMWKLSDQEFFDYARQVVEDCNKRKRPLLPVLNSIQQYKGKIGLTERKPQHKFWISKVPIGSVRTQNFQSEHLKAGCKVEQSTTSRPSSNSSSLGVADKIEGTDISKLQISGFNS